MQTLSVLDILKATEGSLICGDESFTISGITTDSRKAEKGMLFVPIVGENNDGHDYIDGALSLGADAVITHKDTEKREGKNIIRVKDTRKALGDIARYYKEKYNLPTVSITGSVGKTTTKDMIASVLSMKYKTLKTQGNYNNDIGLPLTIFGMEESHQAAVLEMGMSHMGEINYLASIAKPDVAVITNIGMSHIENLGSQENIYRSKMQICDFFSEDGVLIANGDDKFLKNKTDINTITYGVENKEADLVARDVENLGIDGSKFKVDLDGSEYEITVKIPGIHNVYNALAAISAGRKMGVEIADIIEGIKEFRLTGMRMEVKHFGEVTVIDDCYNSAPDSIRAALKVLEDMKADRKIAVLGDVMEMGSFAEKELYDIGVKINNIDILVTVGDIAKYIAKGADLGGVETIKSCKTVDEAIAFLTENVKSGDGILVKASRAMKFEKIVKALEER